MCPWNEKFSLPLREEAFRPRPAVAGKDARTLAGELLLMSDEDFRIAFKNSPMKRAKPRGREHALWGVVASRHRAIFDPRHEHEQEEGHHLAKIRTDHASGSRADSVPTRTPPAAKFEPGLLSCWESRRSNAPNCAD